MVGVTAEVILLLLALPQDSTVVQNGDVCFTQKNEAEHHVRYQALNHSVATTLNVPTGGFIRYQNSTVQGFPE